MTLDEAIKHCEEVAEENEKFCYKKGGKGGYFNEDTDWNNTKCAEEHRQLAEWLKDYKRLKEQEPKTGHWINIDATHSKCDRCEAVFEIASENGEVNYCPNCGVGMVDVHDTNVGKLSEIPTGSELQEREEV